MADLQGRKTFKVFNQDFIVDERYTVTKELGQRQGFPSHDVVKRRPVNSSSVPGDPLEIGGQHINAYFGLVVQAVSTKFVSFDKMVHLGNWSDQPHL